MVNARKGTEFRFDGPDLDNQKIRIPINASWNSDFSLMETYSLTGLTNAELYGDDVIENEGYAWDAEFKSTFTPEELSDGTYDRERWKAVYQKHERSIFVLVEGLMADVNDLKGRLSALEAPVEQEPTAPI